MLMNAEQSPKPHNVDHNEIAKFEAVASRWWDLEGEFKPLHRINPLRLGYISERAGGLFGTKIVLNEFVAYAELAAMPADVLSERSRLLMTYALAGFANFGSLGIMVGGLAPLVPEDRRADLARLAARSLPAGLLSTCITAALVGLIA